MPDGPWDKYKTQDDGPWAKYQATGPQGPQQARASLVQSMAMQAQPKVPQPPMSTSTIGDIYHKQAEGLGAVGDVASNLAGGVEAAGSMATNPFGAGVQAAAGLAQNPAGALGINKPALEQAASSGDMPALLHQVTSPIATALIGALIGHEVPTQAASTKRVNKLAYATGPSSSVDIPRAIQTAMPDLDTAAQGRPPQTVGDLHTAVRTALRTTENEFNLALQPIAGQQVVPTNIAVAIRNSLSSVKTVADQRMARMLDARAVEFEKPWSIGELNAERMKAEARNRAFYSSDASKQMGTLKTKVDAIADKAIADATKDAVYDALGKAHGKDFRALKMRQSSLIDLNDALSDRIRDLSNKTAMQKGAPLLSGENVSVYGRPESGHLGTSIHSLQRIFTNPQASADAAVRGGFASTPSNVYGMPIAVLMPKGRKDMFPAPVPPTGVVPTEPPR